MLWPLIFLITLPAFAAEDVLDQLAMRVFATTPAERKLAAPPASAVSDDPYSYVLRPPGMAYSYVSTEEMVRSGKREADFQYTHTVSAIDELDGVVRISETTHWYVGIKDKKVVARSKDPQDAKGWTVLFPPPKHGSRFKSEDSRSHSKTEKYWWYMPEFTTSRGAQYKDIFALFTKRNVGWSVEIYAAGIGMVYSRDYRPATLSDPVRKTENFFLKAEPFLPEPSGCEAIIKDRKAKAK